MTDAKDDPKAKHDYRQQYHNEYFSRHICAAREMSIDVVVHGAKLYPIKGGHPRA